MAKKIKLYTAVILIGCIFIVVMQNTQAVETKLLFFSIVMPRAALLGITLLIGVLIGFLCALVITDKTKN